MVQRVAKLLSYLQVSGNDYLVGALVRHSLGGKGDDVLTGSDGMILLLYPFLMRMVRETQELMS